MKVMSSFLVLIFFFIACNKVKPEKNSDSNVYTSFGKKIIDSDAITSQSMVGHYQSLKIGDTLNSKMKGTVNAVCQAKGCWMTIKLNDTEEVRVKFKDYGFFVPKDIAGKEVIINGQAFVNELSVEDQKHYAEDAGESKTEIDTITEPKKTYSFIADGVLLVK